MTYSVYNGLNRVLQAARKHNPKAKLSVRTIMDIPEELLQNSKNEHVSLGCMPSLNIYGMKGKEVIDGRTLKTRSTGGHLHFGINNVDYKYPPTPADISRIVKALDAIVGVSCVALFQKYDSPERRKYYGLAGEYRLPKHGIEYRTLSNAWLIHPFLLNIVFDIARRAVMVGWNDYLKHWKGTEQETIDCINNCDVKKAQEIMLRNKEFLMQVYIAAYRGYNKQHYEMLFKIFFNGSHTVITSEDIEKNWLLQPNSNHQYKPGAQFRTAIKMLIEDKQKKIA